MQGSPTLFHGQNDSATCLAPAEKRLVLVLLFPFLYQFLIVLAFLVVAFIAQRLQVHPVKESLLTAHWPWNDVIHTSGRLDYPFLFTQIA